MGFNATIVVMVDSLHEIEVDKAFGKKVSDAILSVGCYNKPVDISCGGHCNAATVIDSHHADQTSLIAVGGNYATVLLPYAGGYAHHTPEAKEAILREFARQMGFTLHRKPCPSNQSGKT